MRIPSGKTDQLVFFVALDSTDRATRKTGLSAFTVYRSRNGGTATVYTTPTVTELSAANMPGVYALTVDEDTTIASGSDSEEYCVHITCATMAPVTRTVELYRRDTTSGKTIAVDSSGVADSNVVNWKGSSAPAMTGDAYARIGAPIGASISADVAAVKAVLPSSLVSGRMDASVGAYQTGLTPLQPATAGRTLVVDAAGLADANVVKLGPTGAGTAQTARDIGTSVLLSSGTGTGQLDFTSGVVKANLAQILATALTETSGQIAGGFKKFFNIGSPAATMDHGVLVDTITTYTGDTPQTGDSFARIGLAGVALTNLGDARLAHLDADISSRSTYAGGDTAGVTTLLSRLGSPVGASISADIAAVAGAVWTVGTRVLTAGTNIALAKGTGVTGFTDLDAAGIRAATGLASANLDTQIGTLATASALATVNTTVNSINTKTTNLPSDPASAATIATEFSTLTTHGDATWAAVTSAASIRAAVGLASANLDNQLAGIDSDVLTRLASSSYTAPNNVAIAAIDGVTSTLVMTAGKLWVLNESGNPLASAASLATTDGKADAIKAQTDQFDFTGSLVNSNIAAVNGTQVAGTGATGDEWGPA